MVFKGRLNELMSQMRMQNQLSALRQDATYQMDTSVQQEVKQVLNIVRLCDAQLFCFSLSSIDRCSLVNAFIYGSQNMQHGGILLYKI